MDPELIELSAQIGEVLTQKGLTIATAESCTGGLLAHIITEIPGSSNYYIGGVVAYSNQIKESVLGVSASTLQEFGAVSWQTAQEMADGIRKEFQAYIGISTTGISGPSGSTATKPVGLVWIGFSTAERIWSIQSQITDTRHFINKKTVHKILKLILEYLETGVFTQSSQ